MPERVNSLSDIGTAKVSSDSYDVDNIFLTDQGWVYRHFKKEDKTEFWDEIIVAGEVDPLQTTTKPPFASNPVTETVYTVIGVDADNKDILGGNEPFAPLAMETTGDTFADIEYSPDFDGGVKTPAEGAARYTTYDQYPPIPTDTPAAPEEGAPTSTPTDVTLEFTGADGTSSYTSAGGANASVTIESGATLTITNNTSGHPVDVRVADGGDTVSTGTLTGAPAGPGTSLTWDTTGVTAGTYYYQCTAHATMIGQIIVT